MVSGPTSILSPSLYLYLASYIANHLKRSLDSKQGKEVGSNRRHFDANFQMDAFEERSRVANCD